MRRGLWLAVIGVVAAACGDSSDTASEPTAAVSESAVATESAPDTTTASGDTVADSTAETAPAPGVTTASGDGDGRCLVRLHGKGGAGGDPSEADGVTILAPTGNADGWGAKQWLYFPAEEYEAARAVVADAVEPCERIIVNGFSNGAAFAAKLYCQGETFDERLVGVVVDDPVVDASVEGCSPAADVAVTLYWTGALESTAQPGWDCSEADWTCEGGTTIGIDAFAEGLGTDARESPFDEHQWYIDAPETMAF